MFNPNSLPIALSRSDIHLVVLNCPYDTISDPQTQSLYGKILDMKITGYLAEYPYGVNPVDGSDIFATHLAVCQDTATGLEPIMAMKSVTLDRCRAFNYPFPAFGLLKDPKNPDATLPDHDAALKEIVDTAIARKEPIAYNSSWAIHPRARKDRVLKQICRDLMVFYLIQHYADSGIPNVLAGATLRFKVEEYKEFVGYEYLSLHGRRLPSIECKPFFGEAVAIMYLRHIREEAKNWAERYMPLWDNRLVIEKSSRKDGESKTREAA